MYPQKPAENRLCQLLYNHMHAKLPVTPPPSPIPPVGKRPESMMHSSKEMVVDKTGRPARWHSYQMERGQNIRNLKRHSEGTFTSDFTHYLDKIKAKDFVEWLASTKREGCHEDLLQIAAEV
ncbi:hypothetical protein PAMP_011994 [Pampus punctatissimus]